MSFSNTQLTKKHVITIIFMTSYIRENIHKHVIFKYAINKKTCHHNYFYDIIYP